jgi:hypothetical protein
VSETSPLELQEEGGAAGAPPATRAQDVVQHFRQGLPTTSTRRPSAKELQQAATLLRDHGDERARAIVSYALREARRTDFHMQYFGAVLGYQEMALAALAQQAHQTQQLAELRQRQGAEQQQLEAERAQEDRAAAVLAALPEAQREVYHQRALAHLPPRMRDMDGLVARRMRQLVIEEGLVAP